MDRLSALQLIIGTLRSANSQVRRNALTALRAVPSFESFVEIVRVSIEDADPTVRERAKDEIIMAGNPTPQALGQALIRQLESKSTGLTTYELIGELRSRGMAVRLPRRSIVTRLKYALSLRRMKYTVRARRLAVWAAVGSLVSAGGLLLYLSIAMQVYLGTIGVCGLIIASFAVPLAIVIISQRHWRPIQRQADRLAAAIIDVVSLSFIGAIVGIAMATGYMLSTRQVTSGYSLFVAVSACALGYGAVRGGSILAHGVCRGALSNRAAQIVTGAATAIGVMTAICGIIGRHKYSVISVVWILTIPSLVSIACVFAKIDGDEYVINRCHLLSGRIGKSATVILVAALLIPALFPLIPKRTSEPRETMLVNGNTIHRVVPMTKLPDKVDLVLDVPTSVKIEVPDEAEGRGDFQVWLRRGVLQTDDLNQLDNNARSAGALDHQDDPPSIEEALAPGNYTIIVDGYTKSSDSRAGLVLSQVLTFLWHRVSLGPRPVQPRMIQCSLKITQQQKADVIPDVKKDADAFTDPEKALEEGTRRFDSSKIDAITYFTRAIQLRPRYSRAFVMRAYAYSWLDQWSLAIEDLGNAIALDSKNESLWKERGGYYDDLGESELSLKDCNRAIELKPSDESAYFCRGRAYAEIAHEVGPTELFRRGIQDDDRAIELKPNYIAAYLDRGLDYLEIGQVEQGQKDLQRALEIQGEKPDGETYSAFAYFYSTQGKYKKAIEKCQLGLKVDPNLWTLYNNIGYAYNMLGDYAGARGYFDKGISLSASPAAGRLYKNRGRSYIGLQQYGRAIEDLNKAISLLPKLGEAYQYRSDAEARLGDSAGAAADANLAKQLGYHAAPKPQD